MIFVRNARLLLENLKNKKFAHKYSVTLFVSGSTQKSYIFTENTRFCLQEDKFSCDKKISIFDKSIFEKTDIHFDRKLIAWIRAETVAECGTTFHIYSNISHFSLMRETSKQTRSVFVC